MEKVLGATQCSEKGKGNIEEKREETAKNKGPPSIAQLSSLSPIVAHGSHQQWPLCVHPSFPSGCLLQS